MARRLRDQVERLLANDRALALIVAMESALDDDRLEARASPPLPRLQIKIACNRQWPVSSGLATSYCRCMGSGSGAQRLAQVHV